MLDKRFYSGSRHRPRAFTIFLMVVMLVFGLICIPGEMVEGQKQAAPTSQRRQTNDGAPQKQIPSKSESSYREPLADETSSNKSSPSGSSSANEQNKNWEKAAEPYLQPRDLKAELEPYHVDFFESKPDILNDVKLPKIILDSRDAAQVNQEILDTFQKLFLQRLLKREIFTDEMSIKGSYEAACNGKVLSIVCELTYDTEPYGYGRIDIADSLKWSRAYNFKLPEGRLLSNQEVLNELGWVGYDADEIIEDTVFTHFLGNISAQGKNYDKVRDRNAFFCAKFPEKWTDNVKSLYISPAKRLRLLYQVRSLNTRESLELKRKEFRDEDLSGMGFVDRHYYPDIYEDYYYCDTVILPRRKGPRMNALYKQIALSYTDINPDDPSAPACFIAYLGTLRRAADDKIIEGAGDDIALRLVSLMKKIHHVNCPFYFYYREPSNENARKYIRSYDQGFILIIPKDPRAEVSIERHASLSDPYLKVRPSVNPPTGEPFWYDFLYGEAMLLLHDTVGSSMPIQLTVRTRNYTLKTPLYLGQETAHGAPFLNLNPGFMDISSNIRLETAKLRTNDALYENVRNLIGSFAFDRYGQRRWREN